MLNVVYIDDCNVTRFSLNSLIMASAVCSDVCMDYGRCEGNAGDGNAVFAAQDMGSAGQKAVVASVIGGFVGGVGGLL